MPIIRLGSRDIMDNLKVMRDSLEDSKDQPHVYDTKNPKDDEEGPKKAKGSFK